MLAVLLAGALAAPVMADQTDPALPDLFSELQSAPNQSAASRIEQRIWAIWLRGPEPEANALLDRARAALSGGSADTAMRLFDELTTRYPDYAEAWNQRAIAHFLLGDLNSSLSDIARTLELEPRHFGALAGSGQCYLRLEMYREALAAFEAALQVDPWLPSARQQVEALRIFLDQLTKPI